MKRFFDILVSAIGLVITAPIMLGAALAIRASSPGPILFRQSRVGRSGRLFDILKFRSMRPAPSGTGPEITVGNDQRITPVGAFLRKWKIDELPQLINVLKGDMSLVGPRPETPKYVALYPDDLRRQILSVRPGITDMASIKYRYESEVLAEQSDPERYYNEVILPDKLAMGVDYARRPTVWNDIGIIFKTALAVLK